MSTKPDFDDYLDRISAIQKAIITGSQSAKFPLPSGKEPFWVNVFLAPRIRPNVDAQSSMITLTLRMILVRAPKESFFQPEWEAKVIDDMVEVIWNFMTNDSYRRLIVSMFTAIQPGFIPGSLKIVNPARIEGVENVGSFLGSAYNLEWQHRMQRDIGT